MATTLELLDSRLRETLLNLVLFFGIGHFFHNVDLEALQEPQPTFGLGNAIRPQASITYVVVHFSTIFQVFSSRSDPRRVSPGASCCYRLLPVGTPRLLAPVTPFHDRLSRPYPASAIPQPACAAFGRKQTSGAHRLHLPTNSCLRP